MGGFYFIQFLAFLSVIVSMFGEYELYGVTAVISFLIVNCAVVTGLENECDRKIKEKFPNYQEKYVTKIDYFWLVQILTFVSAVTILTEEYNFYGTLGTLILLFLNCIIVFRMKINSEEKYYMLLKEEVENYYITKKNLIEQEMKKYEKYNNTRRREEQRKMEDRQQEIKGNEYYQQRVREADNYYNTRCQEGDKYYNLKVEEGNDYYNTKKREVIQYYHEKMRSIDTEYHAKRREAEELLKETQEYSDKQQNFLAELKQQIENLKEDINVLEKKVFIEYAEIPIDENISSEEYKNELSILKLKEKDLIKSDEALVITSWDKKKVLNNNIKQILRCFNAETSLILNSITVKNIDTSRNKLQNCFETINRIFATDGVALSYDFLNLKFEQLRLIYSYMVKAEEERETQRAIREQLIEEQKVLKEIEREKTKLEKEEKQFKNEINKLMSYVRKSSEIEKELYIDKIRELEEKLKALEKDKNNVLQREQNTRAGFVYVISNIGSFGENIYKIGMTRRLEPMDRIKELI